MLTVSGGLATSALGASVARIEPAPYQGLDGAQRAAWVVSNLANSAPAT
jgi:hypothetical protein